jgi:hypothetical protein
MAAEAEVRVKLRLDSNAAAQLKGVKLGFTGAGKAARRATTAVSGFVKQSAAIALGTHLPRIARGIGDIATGWFKASNAAYDQEQAMAGLLMMSRKLDYGEARKGAEAHHKQLLGLAFDIGQEFDQVVAGSDRIQSAFGSAATQMKANHEILTDLTVTANVMGGNVDTMSNQFIKLATQGTLPLTGTFKDLLFSTGKLGDDIADVSKNMLKLKPDERMKLAVDALRATATEMRKTEPTFSDLWGSAKAALQMLKESVGAPVIKALIPVMKDLKDRFKAAGPVFTRLGKTLGKDMAKWVGDAADSVQKGFEYLKTHGHEIKQDLKDAAIAIKDAFQTAYNAAQYIVKNKGTFAAMYGGGKLLGAAGGPMAVGKAVAGAGGGGAAGPMRDAQGRFLKRGAGAAGAVGFGAGLAGVAALTAAVVALGLAADQAAKLINETSDDKSEAEQDNYAKYEAARREFHSGNMARARELATQVAGGSSVHRAYAASLRNEIQAAMDANKALKEQIQGAAGATTVEGLKQLITAYNTAVDQNNVAMMQFAGKTLIASGFAVENFSAAEMNLTGGIDTLRTAVGEYARGFKSEMESIKIDLMLASTKAAEKAKAEDLARDLRAKADAARKAARGGGGGVSITINEIKQEFRKADPDRIVVAFKKDIIRRASRRVQSKRATVFGV